MASTNVTYAVPTANTSVNYDLPASEDVKVMNLSPDNIDGLKLNDNGGLVISTTDGGSMTINNFQSFINNGNTLSLADGTQVDPKLLFSGLGGTNTNDNLLAGTDVTKIGIPAANAQSEVSLESGKKYLLNFDLTEAQGANVKDGKMVIDFENGGKIVIANYEEAMKGKNPPELSLASKTCVVTGDQLITDIQNLAKADAPEQVVVAEEEAKEAAKRKSDIADADMAGKEDIGANGETKLGYKAEETDPSKVEPAAGNENEQLTAQQLAQIDTAAGGGAGARNSGYGFNSRPGLDPFNTNPDIGPLGRTQLEYQAPLLTPGGFLPTDDNPLMIGPDAKFIDETNLDNGPITVSGSIDIDFGADGPGGVAPNGSFSSGGSETAGVLSSNGVVISVMVVGNSYIGMAGAVKVFELAIDPRNGNYTFTQFEQLDHADGNNPNDQISLDFGVVARDGDGDAISTGIRIVIADDAPTASGASGSVDETNLGPVSVSGTLTVDFGQDGAGRVQPSDSFSAGGSLRNNALSSSGVAVVVTKTDDGYVGKAGNVVVFELALNPQTGAFVYTQYQNLDHANQNDPNDVIRLTFGTEVVDYDGDKAPAPIVIDIIDDAPVFVDCGCDGDLNNPDKAVETVDETNLKAGPLVETGSLTVDFGADAPGSIAFKDGSFVSGGSRTGNALTHNGVPVVVTLQNGVYIGKAGTLTIFTMEIANTGDYKYTQFDNFDHANGNDPNDVITLDFAVVAKDFEGDSVEGSIRVNVKDDAPIARDDVNAGNAALAPVTGNVVTGLNGGPNAVDVISTDAPNRVSKISFGDAEVNVPTTGTVSIDGDNGRLTISADGSYTYTAFADAGDNNGNGADNDAGGEVKTFNDIEYAVDFNEGQAIDANEQKNLGVAPGNLDLNGGETVTVTFVSETAGFNNTFGAYTITADGTLKAEQIFTRSADDLPAGQTFSVTASDEAKGVGFFVLTAGALANNDYAGLDFSAGKLDFVFDLGKPGEREAKITDNGNAVSLVFTAADGTETVLVGNKYFTTDRGDSLAINNDDKVHVVSGLADDADKTVLRVGFEDLPNLGDKDYNDFVFDVKITGKDDCGCECGGGKEISDKFVYTLVDNDGDTSKATLTVNGVTADAHPIIIAPAVETIDETNLKDGIIVETGTLQVNFGTDGPGTITPNATFTSSGSKLNGALTSGGVPVNVTFENGLYKGTTANGVAVFSLDVKNDGSYTFKLFEQLDHADGSNPNDVITLDFGVCAVDCDGDTELTKITVNVKDDAPVANDDGQFNVAEKGTITGNVTSNDAVGQDVPGKVVAVNFNGTSVAVPATGTVNVVGAHGTLTISSTGAYSYTAKANTDGVDAFTYTLKDRDGDTDTAVLSVCVKDQDDTPMIIKPATEVVDETNLSSGTITETGSVTANFFGDGPGSFSATGSFTSSGSKLNNALTHMGQPVAVALSGNTYVGTANGVTVFTLQVAANGTYTFKLLEQLDHADGSNPNDIITLDFGVVATDADGDKSQTTTITVNVKDDAPVANDDGQFNVAEKGTITGNVTSNDAVGQDVPGKVVAVNFNGTSVAVPATGTVNVVGAHGTLTISSTGAYSYTAKANTDGVDAFTYTLKDRDGDTDTAVLSVCVKDQDDTPMIIKPATEVVDETNLSSGTITETGSVTANFFGDGPGSFSATGSFTSSGSKLNNALTHMGQPVAVALSGNTYVGTANGVTVFTLQVAANGTYTFKLLEQLDHADGSNPNDIITLDFGVVATDADGDKSQTTTITVNVKDDAPVANDDGQFNVAEKGTITGNVTSNDAVGQDVPGKVVAVNFNGTSVAVPATGTVNVVGAHGTLTISSTGAYSYTAKANTDGVDAFTYTLKDRDGDTDTAVLSVCVKDQDDTPMIIKPATEVVDETNLSSGTITETGSVTANFFGDGPGSFSATGSFTSSGSKLNNALTHMGQPVAVALSGNTYVGTANGVTVFTLQVAANGTYTFKLLEQLDHADGSNPNDIITLDFGVVATDADGDKSQTTTITVNVKDDAPVANDDGQFNVAEKGTITGNVTSNDAVGQDVPGKVVAVNFNGTSVAVPATGTVNVVGAHGTLTISSTGAYSYTAKANTDGVDAFTYTLKDRDGDTDTAVLSVCVKDQDDTPMIIKPATEVVDETNLSSGTITETGSVTANFFGDGPGSFSATGSFTSSGSKLNNALTHMGQPVAVALSGNTYVGTANGVTVFTLQVAANGTYTFKLLEQLDHADGSNPNDIITLDFGVVATDADGDKSQTTTITVNVKDDAPVANDDGQFNVAEKGTITGNVTSNDAVGQDVPGKVVAVNFNGTSVAVPATGTVNVVGAHGTLTISSTGAYSYTAKANTDGVDAFTYTLKDRDGDTDTAVLSVCVKDQDDTPMIIKPATEVVDETNLSSGTITETGSVTANFFGDGPGSFSATGSFTSSGSKLNNALTHMGQPVAVALSGNTYVGTANGVTVFTLQVAANGTYTFKLLEQLDHADGSNPNDIITLDFGVVATDADGDKSQTTTITVNVKDDAPVANDDGQFNVAEKGTITGNVTSNDAVGQDVPGKVVAVNFNGTSVAVPATGTVNVVGAHGTLTISSTGAYSYTAKANTDGVDAFTYTLKDRDGDTDTAVLSVCVKDQDDTPMIIKPATEVVDETNLSSGTITETGSVTANFFGDGPGSFSATGSFTSSGSKLNNALTHMGQPVAVALSGNTYVGTANGVTVFTLQVAANGTYTFKLLEQLDHADGSNPNDIITLDFGVVATDADGDKSQTTTITVNVKDDAPVANDDACTLLNQTQISSNALTNDRIGQDAPGRVSAVTFGGRTYSVPTSGDASISTMYGVLMIAASGAYTFRLNNALADNATENLTLTVTDADGDHATSNLQINIIGAGNGFNGTEGDDTLFGYNDRNDVMNGNGGADWLYGQGGDDTINGGAGNDNLLDGGTGNDTIYGGAGDDLIAGREGNDMLYGGVGNDTIYADGNVGDILNGNNTAYGEDGNDFLYGGSATDYLDGGNGNDVLYGYGGNDTLVGGSGDDHLIGGAGNDTLSGGAGADTFWFLGTADGVDHITDFRAGENDKLEFSNLLTNFDPLTEAINDFVFASFDGTNTTISVNQNGTGAAGATAVVVLDNANVTVTDLYNNGHIVA